MSPRADRFLAGFAWGAECIAWGAAMTTSITFGVMIGHGDHPDPAAICYFCALVFGLGMGRVARLLDKWGE